jgi:hypothetical protein
MRPLPALLVAAIVLLAGCSGLFPGGPAETEAPTPTAGDETPTRTTTTTPTARPTTTVAPTPTTTRSPTTTEPPGNDTEPLAPGVTGEGIVNPIALLSAHQRELLADGFVANVTYENVGNGTVQWRTTQRTIAGPGGERAVLSGTAGESNAIITTQDVWLNATHATLRRIEDDETAYTVEDRLTPPEALVMPGPILSLVQTYRSEYAVTNVETRDGRRYVTLSATIDRVGGDETADTEATMLVDERGVVHSIDATTNYGGGDDWHVTYAVERIGGVDPDPPSWLAEVPRNASVSADLFTGMGPEGVLTIDHNGGDPVPAGTHVTILQNGALYEARLEEPLRPGDTLYVYLDAATGELQVGTTEPAGDEYEPLAREFTVRVFTGDGVELLEESLGW